MENIVNNLEQKIEGEIRIRDLPNKSAVLNTDRFYLGDTQKDYSVNIQALYDLMLKGDIGSRRDFFIPKDKIPSQYLVCDGSEVNKIDYPDLFNLLGDTWGTTNNKDTFKLPNLMDQFIRGASQDSNLGTYNTDTMRKITGFGGEGYYSKTFPASGAFRNSIIYENSRFHIDNNNNYAGTRLDFDSAYGIEGQEGTVSPNVGAETAPKHAYAWICIRAK